MANYDEARVRQRLTADLEQVERDIYARTSGEQAIAPSEGIDGTGVTSEQSDEGTALTEYERNQAMVDNDRALQRQIREALERLDMGKYGICERCGKEINARRLEALPYVTLCLEDQEKVERGEA
ncbi:MAG TPA: TraR/DksA C4-type zinc finger protein [Ktedonobacterales bacterium]|jgi:DnaK suppressor protein|nr:TraR/DksA C4-type zinc finger protein [Ktedonobacterales bacterium]